MKPRSGLIKSKQIYNKKAAKQAASGTEEAVTEQFVRFNLHNKIARPEGTSH